MTKFFLLFLFLLLLMFAAELSAPGQQWLVVPFTEALARFSGWIAQLFDTNVVAYGAVMQNRESGFSVSIEAGCNGIEAVIILVAAMLSFPASWKMKLVGILAGILAIQAMNLLRIISLYYLGQWSETAFEWAHLYLWQSLIMLDVLVVFLLWLRYLGPTGNPPLPPEDTVKAPSPPGRGLG